MNYHLADFEAYYTDRNLITASSIHTSDLVPLIDCDFNFYDDACLECTRVECGSPRYCIRDVDSCECWYQNAASCDGFAPDLVTDSVTIVEYLFTDLPIHKFDNKGQVVDSSGNGYHGYLLPHDQDPAVSSYQPLPTARRGYYFNGN